MELRYKVVLLEVVPLVLAAGVLAFVVEREGTALADRQIAEVEQNLLDAEKAELRDLIAIARNEIRDLEGLGADGQKQALQRLEHLSFGADGYFFVYGLDGKCLMHPRQPELVGREMLNFTDDRGMRVIQESIKQATSSPNGGFLVYRWQQPSQRSPLQWKGKLGWFVSLPRWSWMIGTGIYLDKVEETKDEIRASSSAAIRRTMISIGVVAVLAVLAVGALGVALNVSQQRFADAKLRKLTRQVVDAQEAERARVSRYLHDEAVQDLIAVKCILETAILELKSHPPPGKLAERLEQGLVSLTTGVAQIRTISHHLRPPLQSRGLPARLEQIGAALSERTGVMVTVDVPTIWQRLSTEGATALLRIAEQALDNIERHAHASRVTIQLAARRRRGRSGIFLVVHDDGSGFNVTAVEARPGSGIGLLNMRERVEALGGRLSIRSSVQGTKIEAYLPDDAHGEDSYHGDSDAQV